MTLLRFLNDAALLVATIANVLSHGQIQVEGNGTMKSPVVKRSVVINGHKTSISLEDAFWSELKAIASDQRLALSALLTTVDGGRGEASNLSSALRCFVLARYYTPATAAGSLQAPGHQQSQPATP